MKHKIFNIFLLFFLFFTNIVNAQNYDIRKNIDILHCEINLDMTNFKNKIISGNSLLQITSRTEQLNEISLDFGDLKVDSIKVNSNNISIFSHYNKILFFPLKSPVMPSDTISVCIYYHGNPEMEDTWGGFFFTEDAAFNMGVGMSVNPHCYGRVWFPCIDSFTEKATYDFNIKVPADFMAVCSGILIDAEKNIDKTETFHWKMNDEIPSYLVSVAVGKYSLFYKKYMSGKKEIPIEVYVREALLKNVESSFANIENAVSSFENHYGNYRWDRIGYVCVPFRSGAMEHACNIAYPEYAVDGTLNKETLMAHELSHSWFGNLVTCETDKDMWLNEGWASFSEALFKESVYGKKAYKKYVRKNHEDVLTRSHIRDNGYRAVYGIPHKYTYGSTVYDKGADVAHTLRGYMGDSIFFSSLTAYLEKFAYKTASTHDFCDFLSQYSGIKLDDFFDNWVFTAGFPYFYIETFDVETIKNVNKKQFDIHINIKQELKERANFGKNNKAELCFFDKKLNRFTKSVNFSGKSSSLSVRVPFFPENVFFDIEEKISDITVDNYKIVSKRGTYIFPNTKFEIEINKISDSVLIRSSLNYIAPENTNSNFETNKTSFWNISGVNNEYFIAKGIFFIDNLNNSLSESIDKMVLLYRKKRTDKWEKIDFNIKINSNKNKTYFVVSDFKFGEYTLGIKK